MTDNEWSIRGPGHFTGSDPLGQRCELLYKGTPVALLCDGDFEMYKEVPEETEGDPFDRYGGIQHSPSTESAFNKQVAGSHYKGMKIQPMEYALANNLGYCEATALKYISRWKLKGGIADLDKAIHFLELLKEYASKHPEELKVYEYRIT